MGCNTSKLDDEEAVQICKDRKKFIKQALEHRTKFASGHIAYVQSLKRVSAALREYIERDEPREFSLDSFITPPFTPVKKLSPKFITISPNCFSAPTIQSGENSNVKINYYRPSGIASVSVEERVQSPDTYCVQSFPPTIQSEENSDVQINYYRPSGTPSVAFEERAQSSDAYRVQSYPTMHQYGFDGFFTMQSPQRNSSYYSHQYSPYNNGPEIPPPSPQNASQWDFFWYPFSSLDYYGYPMRSSLEQSILDDDIAGLRQVREEEGIPELEEETEHEEIDERRHRREVIPPKRDSRVAREEVTVEDVHEDEDEDDDDDDEDDETETEDENQHEANGLQDHANNGRIASSQMPNAGHVEVNRHENTISEREKKEEETPGFTVYVNRRPTSMDEVIKDLESQFMIVCGAANEVSAMLEANRAHCLPASNEVTAIKMLNPATLFRSASSHSSSSRFLVNSSESSRDERSDSSSYLTDESSMFSGSHHSTLDRLYAWEKRLYEEVRAGERVRLAYEKKCTQLKNQAAKGEEPPTLEKTRIALRDLHTQIKVSIHSIEAISKRIETLRDQELQPQLLELVQGLARMWKVMAECHQMQKHTLDEAKLLLAGTPSKLNGSKRHHHPALSATDPQRLARSTQNLESELRNWRACFASWITSQRSYIHAMSSWLLRCMRRDPNTSDLPFSPRHSAGVHPIFGICIQWTRLLDGVCETPVLDGLDFFSAGMGSIYAQSQSQAQAQAQTQTQNIGGSRRFEESGGGMEVVEVGKVEDVMTPEKMAEVAVRVLCAGMSVAMSSLAEFAISSAEGYAELVKQWENVKWPPSPIAQ